MTTGRFQIPTFDELLKRVKQPKVTVKDLLVEPTGGKEFDTEGATQLGYKIPKGWYLRKTDIGDSLISPRGHTFSNFKLNPDGSIADFNAFNLDGKPIKFPKPPPPPPISPVSERITAPFAIPKPPVGELRPLTAEETARREAPKPQEVVTTDIPTFSEWSATKGFDMAEYGSMLRKRGVAEADIPEMLLTTQRDLRDVYEFEYGLGRWGTAGGEFEKIAVAEPKKLLDVAKVFGQSLTRVPKQLRASIIQASQGMGGASVTDRDWADRLIVSAQTDIGEFAQEISEKYPESKLMESFAQLPQNIAFSLTSMGAGLATGVPTALLPVPGARIAAWGVGSAASGAVAYSMTTYQIMQQYLEAKNEEMIATRGSGITAEEEKQLKADFEGKARAYGLWEAVPEAISNLAFAKLLTAPLTKMVGGNIAKSIITRLVGIYGEELLTETITQKGQSAIEVEAGLREGKITWVEAFKEVAPQTFLLTTILGGVGSVSIASVNKIKQSLKTEIGTDHPLYQTLLREISNRQTEILQEGAMAQGGLPAKPTSLTPELWNATPIAQRVINATSVGLSGQVGSKAFEQLTQAEITALSKVTPAPTPTKGAVVTAKEPWQMTKAEYVNLQRTSHKPLAGYKGKLGRYGASEQFQDEKFHKSQIERALREGKPVPAEVLADYPDLAKVTPVTLEVTGIPTTPTEIKVSKSITEIEWSKFSGLEKQESGRIRGIAPSAFRTETGVQMTWAQMPASLKAELGRAVLIPKVVTEPVTETVTRVIEERSRLLDDLRRDLVETDIAGEAITILPDGVALTGREFRGVGAFQHLAEDLPPVGAWIDAGAIRIAWEEGNNLSIELGETITAEQFPRLNKEMRVATNVIVDVTDYTGKTIKTIEGTPNVVRRQLRTLISKPEPPAAVPVEEVAPTRPTAVEKAVAPPPAKPPTGITPPEEAPIPPEGRPRTLTDLNREAKGMRALTPEERAGVMDMAKPIAEGELIYKVKPFNEHGDILLQPDKPINKVLRSVPGIKQATEILYPAQMERDNPVALIGIKKRIFEEIETGRARLSSLKWWYQAKQAFDFKKVKGKWRATNITLSPKAEPTKAYHATIHDLIEHPDNYVFTEQQQKVLQAAQDIQNQILRDAQRVGVDAVELSGDYWRRIVTKAPKGTLFDGKVKSRITQRKGYTRQRAFDFVDDGAKLGFEYETHPLRSLQNRLESGIRTISDQSARKEIAKLPGVEKPLERLESRYPQTLEGVKQARQARDTAKKTFLRNKTTENETTLRQAEADYINSMRELYFKKIAAGQPNIGELKLPNGRIAPAELAEEISKWIELPEIRTARGAISNDILGVTQLLRATLTNLDLAAGFIQGQALFYRNNPAWWISQGNAILSLADDRMAYVEKNFEMMDEGMRVGAISVPTEFMFTSQGLASIPTRVPVVGPVMKAFNRAFEWFIIVGQTEMYKAARSGVIRRATGANVKRGEALERQAVEALTSLGSAIRKEMGTESYAILGVRPTQHTIEQLVFFAARFFRALTGIQAQAFTGGEGGREARRAMGSLIAGGLALLIGIVWATEKKLPNMTDPFAPDWMMFKIGNTYFTTFGPFYPYFRAQARASVRMAQGLPIEAGKVITRFLESKEGLLFRGIDMAAQFSMYGSYRTFEGKRLPATPAGVTEAVLGEMAVPISIQEAMTSLPEGRYESLVGEIWGLVGRKVRQRASTEAISKLGQIDQEALDKALKGITNEKKIAEIKAEDWTYDISSLRRDIADKTKYLLEQDIAKLEPIVGAYWQFAEQKDEYELLSTKEQKAYLNQKPYFTVNRLFWGDDGLTTIPDLATANAVVALADKHKIPLNLIPAFKKTEKGKERIPSDRTLWKPYFDYYDLPGNSYLNMTKEQVEAGELPEKYRAEWETYQKLKTDVAKAAFKKGHSEAAKSTWRDDFRRANPEFDQWLQSEKGMKPLPPKKAVRRTGGLGQLVGVGGRLGMPSARLGRARVSSRQARVTYPKFKKPRISTAMTIKAPSAPRI